MQFWGVDILKIKKPICRFEFFLYCLYIAVFGVLLNIVYKIFGNYLENLEFYREIGMPVLCFLVVSIIFVLYYYFVIFTKRLWHITGSKKISVITMIIINLLSAVILFVEPALLYFGYLFMFLLCFIPGKNVDEKI